jgi:hypothetical protein
MAQGFKDSIMMVPWWSKGEWWFQTQPGRLPVTTAVTLRSLSVSSSNKQLLCHDGTITVCLMIMPTLRRCAEILAEILAIEGLGSQ